MSTTPWWLHPGALAPLRCADENHAGSAGKGLRIIGQPAAQEPRRATRGGAWSGLCLAVDERRHEMSLTGGPLCMIAALMGLT